MMTFINNLKLVMGPIILTISGEFLLKIMMSRSVSSSTELFLHPFVFLALFLIVTGGFLWLYGMSRLSLSFMYPFMSLNYIVIILGSDIGLNESVSVTRYGAVALIGLGLLFISRSPNASS